MDENKKLAHKHFGSSADNMTVTLTVFSPLVRSAAGGGAGVKSGAAAGGGGSPAGGSQAEMST